MAYTGYTVKHLIVKAPGKQDGKDAQVECTRIFLADNDSATRLQDWFIGKDTQTPDRRPKGPAPITVKGAQDDEERLECLEFFGADVTDIPNPPEGKTLKDVITFGIEDFRYDTIDVFFTKRQAGRLEKMVSKKASELTVEELQSEMAKLSPDERMAFLMKLAGKK